MSAASKTPKTPNNSVEVPTAADAVTVENSPTTQIRSCANRVGPTDV